mmetsp:Transcript_14889/g.28894  ORF Transcript_14889/g.28894 Transcript_14889/m.28894 type:complete len:951 (-) Transcript_14889:68-2920(-)
MASAEDAEHSAQSSATREIEKGRLGATENGDYVKRAFTNSSFMPQQIPVVTIHQQDSVHAHNVEGKYVLQQRQKQDQRQESHHLQSGYPKMTALQLNRGSRDANRQDTRQDPSLAETWPRKDMPSLRVDTRLASPYRQHDDTTQDLDNVETNSQYSEPETMTIRLADLSRGLAEDMEGLRINVASASQFDWNAKPRSVKSMRDSFGDEPRPLSRSGELNEDVFRHHDYYYKATGRNYLASTLSWQQKLQSSDKHPDQLDDYEVAAANDEHAFYGLGITIGEPFSYHVNKMTTARENGMWKKDQKNLERPRREVDPLPESSRLTRPTVASASREVSRNENVELDQLRLMKLQREVSAKEEQRYRKLMLKETALSSGRKRMLRKHSFGNDRGTQENFHGPLEFDAESWISASEPGPSPRGKGGNHKKPTKHLISTTTEATHTWGTMWGTREQVPAAWVGPQQDTEESPVENSDWFTQGSHCEGSNPSEDAFLVDRPDRRVPKLSKGSLKILQASSNERKPIAEQSKNWALKKQQRRAAVAMAADECPDEIKVDTKQRTGGHKRYAKLQEEFAATRRFENAEADSLVSLVATLPDEFRQNVVKMIKTMPTGCSSNKQESLTELKNSHNKSKGHNLQASKKQLTEQRHWGHRDVIQEHADAHANENKNCQASTQNGPSSKTKPSNAGKKPVYHPSSINAHVERLREFREQQAQKKQAEQRRMNAEGWKPGTTIQQPFHFLTATRSSRPGTGVCSCPGTAKCSSFSSGVRAKGACFKKRKGPRKSKAKQNTKSQPQRQHELGSGSREHNRNFDHHGVNVSSHGEDQTSNSDGKSDDDISDSFSEIDRSRPYTTEYMSHVYCGHPRSQHIISSKDAVYTQKTSNSVSHYKPRDWCSLHKFEASKNVRGDTEERKSLDDICARLSSDSSTLSNMYATVNQPELFRSVADIEQYLQDD